MTKILLDESQRLEIESLKIELMDHIKNYGQFKQFIKTSQDALKIADALLNNDFKTFSKYKLKFTKHAAEKMKGMQSLNTYKRVSDICRFLSQHDGICKKCYANRSIELYKTTLKPSLIYNTLLLKYIDLQPSQIPFTNENYFRFESFSDLQGSKHFNNLIKVCRKNKNTIFTLWTKAGYTLVNMMKKESIKKLPSNLNIIYSEFYLNKKTNKEYMEGLQSCLNTTNKLKVFIVYNDEKLRNNSGLYLCKNKCIDCLKCYKRNKKDILYIAEKIH